MMLAVMLFTTSFLGGRMATFGGAHRSAGRELRASATTDAPAAFLTREDGKNGKLEALLASRGIKCAELPCIAFERLAGFDELQVALKTGGHGWVVITSPEAAGVFVEAWRAAGEPPRPPLASVGAGTARILAAAGLPPDFVPSKATGKTLATELPPPSDVDLPVLYPASALAANVVADGLAARGMRTQRIDTYTTVPATWASEQLSLARAATVVTFGSPSAVRVWAERAGNEAVAVCIGGTSAAEARRVGFQRVHCPDEPGVEAWADTVAALGLWS